MNQMSPPAGAGTRASVEIYEVAIDESPSWLLRGVTPRAPARGVITDLAATARRARGRPRELLLQRPDLTAYVRALSECRGRADLPQANHFGLRVDNDDRVRTARHLRPGGRRTAWRALVHPSTSRTLDE